MIGRRILFVEFRIAKLNKQKKSFNVTSNVRTPMHSGKSGAASYLEPTLYLRKQIAHPILLFLFLLVTKPFYEVSVRCNGDDADH